MRPASLSRLLRISASSLAIVVLLGAAASCSLGIASADATEDAAAGIRTRTRSLSSAVTTLPTTVVATWISLSPESSSSSGLPGARCDAIFTSLEGRSQQPNAGVPFPGGVAPTSDAWNEKIWLFGGWNSDQDFSDSWILDVSQSTPVWSSMEEVNASSVIPRVGTPVAFIPNGLVSDDVGLTAVLCGGANSDGYVAEVSTFNFASRTWRQLSLLDYSDSSVPFPRAFTEWYAMPEGFGTGTLSDADAGTFFMIGGVGSSDGGLYTVTNHDYSDQWIYNVSSLDWTRFGDYECTENTTTCTDETTIAAFLAEISLVANATATAVDLTASVRPSSIYAAVERIVAGWAESNLTASSSDFVDDPSACTTACTAYETVAASNTTSFTPSGIEGTRGVVFDGKLYEFGGYMCTASGVQAGGGTDCYLGSMWILDFATMEWSEIAPPTSGSDDAIYADYWPSKRAYNIIAVDESRELIIVHGGGYQDSSGVQYYYQDTYAFSISVGQFVPFTVSGVLPPISWSAGGAMVDDALYYFGGCTTSTYYASLYVLKIGLAVEASNCYAEGNGLTKATAGQKASFTIQTRESSYATNATLNTTELVWGANATYGTDLTFTAQLISATSSDVTLTQAQVTEIGDGLYRVSYTLDVGVSFRLFIYLGDEEIPNSPFSVTLEPGDTPSGTRTTASGLGTSLTAKGKRSTVLIQLVDEYGNDFEDTSAWSSTDEAGLFMNGNSSLALAAMLGPDVSSLAVLDGSFVNNQNGSFFLTYDIPKVYDSFLLAITLNGASVSGSPFTVEALDPIELSQSVVIAFSVLTGLAIFICISAAIFVSLYREEPIMRASSPNFLHLLILGSVLTSLSVVFLLIESDYACRAYHSLLSVGLVMSLSALLAKSHRVERIFNARILKVHSALTDARLMIPTSGVVILMLLINLLWIGIDPVSSTDHASSTSSEAAVLSFKSCGGLNGTSWLAGVLAYCGAILVYGVYLAVKTGHVPSQFNEVRQA